MLRNYFGKRIEGPARDLLSPGSAATSEARPTLARVKFTDGYWQLRDGVQARYPAQVYDVKVESDALTVYAPTRKIENRGDTLMSHC